MIQYIERTKLVPHPQNPRINLGDLEELAASIKERGIMQNLTAIENETSGLYTVIIGHRRLAASDLAGLDELPVKVVEMNEETQLATMLMENMQRKDLTPYEQAQGFQQVLDLGVTVQEISKKTGLTQKTVKQRVKMLDLDQKKVMAAANSSIDDFIQLESIEDIEEKNRLLQFMGTNNFGIEVMRSLKKQEDEKNVIEEIIEEEPVVELTPEQVEEKKFKDLLSITYALRLDFIEEVFKRKLTGPEIALASYVLIEQQLENNVHNNFYLYNDLVNPNMNDVEVATARASKHRGNYLVVLAYVALEQDKKNVGRLYSFLEELGYVLSDDEKEMLENA